MMAAIAHTVPEARPAAVRRGFTLIELLVTMALLAIMLALAAPSFISFQRNSDLTSSANAFVAALSAARAEAMKRQLRVFVIPGDGISTSTNWATGWTVFVDMNSNVTTGAMLPEAGTDLVIARQAALPTVVSVDTTSVATPFADGSARYAMFNGSGFMTSISGSFTPQALDLTNGSETRRIIANPTGRLRVCKPADAGCDASGAL